MGDGPKKLFRVFGVHGTFQGREYARANSSVDSSGDAPDAGDRGHWHDKDGLLHTRLRTMIDWDQAGYTLDYRPFDWGAENDIDQRELAASDLADKLSLKTGSYRPSRAQTVAAQAVFAFSHGGNIITRAIWKVIERNAPGRGAENADEPALKNLKTVVTFGTPFTYIDNDAASLDYHRAIRLISYTGLISLFAFLGLEHLAGPIADWSVFRPLAQAFEGATSYLFAGDAGREVARAFTPVTSFLAQLGLFAILAGLLFFVLSKAADGLVSVIERNFPRDGVIESRLRFSEHNLHRFGEFIKKVKDRNAAFLNSVLGKGQGPGARPIAVIDPPSLFAENSANRRFGRFFGQVHVNLFHLKDEAQNALIAAHGQRTERRDGPRKTQRGSDSEIVLLPHTYVRWAGELLVYIVVAAGTFARPDIALQPLLFLADVFAWGLESPWLSWLAAWLETVGPLGAAGAVALFYFTVVFWTTRYWLRRTSREFTSVPVLLDVFSFWMFVSFVALATPGLDRDAVTFMMAAIASVSLLLGMAYGAGRSAAWFFHRGVNRWLITLIQQWVLGDKSAERQVILVGQHPSYQALDRMWRPLPEALAHKMEKACSTEIQKALTSFRDRLAERAQTVQRGGSTSVGGRDGDIWEVFGGALSARELVHSHYITPRSGHAKPDSIEQLDALDLGIFALAKQCGLPFAATGYSPAQKKELAAWHQAIAPAARA